MTVPATTVFTAATQRSWCTITEWYIVFRPCVNTNTDGSWTTGLDPIMLVVDRERSGWWSVWRYPDDTAMGACGNPFQAVVFGVDNLIFMAGADGQVYCQPTRTVDQNQMYGVFQGPQFTPDEAPSDAGATDPNVTATYRSRMSDYGSPLLQKQARTINLVGTCAAGTADVSFNTLGINGQINEGFEPVSGQGQTIPFEASFGLGEMPAGFANYYLCQVEFSAASLWLRGWGLVWRAMRESTRGNLNG